MNIFTLLYTMKIIFNLLTNTIINTNIKASSKDRNLVPFLVFDVFVNGEDEEEHEEEASAAKEVPDVMPDKNNVKVWTWKTHPS